jgi:hypothetical protein
MIAYGSIFMLNAVPDRIRGQIEAYLRDGASSFRSILRQIPHPNKVPLVVGVLSVPMSLFLEVNAYYLGMLPILSDVAQQAGIPPEAMAKASPPKRPRRACATPSKRWVWSG